MTAEAILPSAKPSDAAEAFVMMETISTPGAISRVTSQLTAPSTSLVTFPFSMLRALICMVGRIVSNGSRHSNRIAIEMEPSHRLPHVADHIVQAVSIGWEGAHGRSAYKSILAETAFAATLRYGEVVVLSLRERGFGADLGHPRTV